MIPIKIVDITEVNLLRAIQNDDQIAFKQLFKKYWSKLFIYAFNVLNDKDVCKDIVQEVFVDLWQRRYDINVTDISSYLYKAVKNQIFKQFINSKFKNRILDDFDLFQAEINIESTLEYKELSKRVEELMAYLPEQRRNIYRMSRDEDLSNKEIAEKLNLSVQTVKNQISAALKFIRNSLKNFYALL